MTTKTLLIASGTTFAVPSDFGSLVAAYAIGAAGNPTSGGAGSGYGSNKQGGTGGNGGGGGAFAELTALSLSANQVVNCQIGTAGGVRGTSSSPGTADTWFDSSGTLYAQGGSGYVPGNSSNCVPTTNAASGGYGYLGSSGTYGYGATGGTGGGGGGAGGPNGDGESASNTYNGGGGDAGFGGIGSSNINGSGGDVGAEWSITAGGTAGSGGGGSGSYNAGGGRGGIYGAAGGGGCGGVVGGSGPGSPGISSGGCIVFVYTTAVASTTIPFFNMPTFGM